MSPLDAGASHGLSAAIYSSYTNDMMPKPTGAPGPSQPMPLSTAIPAATFLTLQEVADLLRLSPITIHRLVRRGKLQAFRLTRHFRFLRADVLAFLDNGRAPTMYAGS